MAIIELEYDENRKEEKTEKAKDIITYERVEREYAKS